MTEVKLFLKLLINENEIDLVLNIVMVSCRRFPCIQTSWGQFELCVGYYKVLFPAELNESITSNVSLTQALFSYNICFSTIAYLGIKISNDRNDFRLPCEL